MESSLSSTKVKVADYLFARLCQLGVGSIFGVPGDYNLRLLDFVKPAGLHWVGNCNELNAAYAADGYARINGISVLITTFGVGELSALNGVAGAYAEKVPIIHIVGTPSRELQESRALMHHTFADGDYRRFATIHSHVTVAQANLTDPRTIPQQIDWILEQALMRSRPVYVELPSDMVDILVSGSDLTSKKISLPVYPVSEQEASVLSQVLERMYAAERPLILVDGEYRRPDIVKQIEAIIRITEWPTWTTIFGKSLVNEHLHNVYGIYSGTFGDQQLKAYFDSADIIMNFGPHYTGTNSYAFTTIPNDAVSIKFSDTTIRVDGKTFRDVSSNFLAELLQKLDHSRLRTVDRPPKPRTFGDEHLESSEKITQKHFYRVVNPIIRAGDIVLTETGTASHGGRDFKLPPNTRLFGAVTWLSIGYMLPATLGAALARRELNAANNISGTSTPKSRAILFIGDGSLQMTVQELGTIIKEKLDVIVIIINNDGYTIERAIHGRKQSYNDIVPWRHLQALTFFGADEDHAAKNVFTARTWGELETVLRDERIQEGKGLRLVEVFMDREDVQGSLLRLLERQKAEEEGQ